MCGIVGYIGKKEALPILIKGLTRLEYRGYDSSGVAILENKKIERIRSVGKIEKLNEKLESIELHGNVGIAHTRWATHGDVTEKNAHPHFGTSGKLAIVHNGIIENYRELREKFLKDVKLKSETDTEILACLIDKFYKKDLRGAILKALSYVRGTYGLVVIHEDYPDTLIAARFGSPLVIGVGENEYYIASDTSPMLAYTKRVIFLEDRELTEIKLGEEIKIFDLKDKKIVKNIEEIDWDESQAEKQGYDHFMLKEIFDQPQVFEDAIRGRTNLEEIKARKAPIILIANNGDINVKELTEDIIYIPETMELLEPLLNTIPLQLFAYHMAVILKKDVDRPRNLAKSVTVE